MTPDENSESPTAPKEEKSKTFNSLPVELRQQIFLLVLKAATPRPIPPCPCAHDITSRPCNWGCWVTNVWVRVDRTNGEGAWRVLVHTSRQWRWEMEWVCSQREKTIRTWQDNVRHGYYLAQPWSWVSEGQRKMMARLILRLRSERKKEEVLPTVAAFT